MTVDVEQIRESLYKPFDVDMVKQVSKGGTKLDYIPGAEVIARLNLALGTENWGIDNTDAWRDPINTNWILAKVTLWAEIDGKRTTKVGFGGQQIKFRRDSEEPNDLGDEYKGASTDAFKKAAQMLGIGLELARSQEALDIEEYERQVIKDADLPKATKVELKKITDTVKDLDPDLKGTFNSWWKENVRHTPDSGNVTKDQATSAVEFLATLKA